jgi:hypothetical protein
MLVKGIGSRIANTNSYVWPVNNVIAVFEIKKSLHSRELVEAEATLSSVRESFSSYMKQKGVQPRSVGFTYAGLTGRVARVDAHKGDLITDAILNTLEIEFVAPLRIVFAYDGYASEAALRKGYLDVLEQIAKPGIMPTHLPHLVVCGGNSIIKLTGQPYYSPFDDGYWRLIGSSADNPLRFLLEMLFYRLDAMSSLARAKEEDLQGETIHPLLYFRFFIAEDGLLGSELETIGMSTENLSAAAPTWEPFELTPLEWALLRIAQHGPIEFTDPRLQEWAYVNRVDIDDLLPRLVDFRLIALAGPAFCAAHRSYFTMMADGRMFTARSADEKRLHKYVEENRHRARPSLIRSDVSLAMQAWRSWLAIAGMRDDHVRITDIRNG